MRFIRSILDSGKALLESKINSPHWANVDYYKSQNKQLQSEVNQGDRVVFMGDSITENWLTYQPDFFKNKFYINRGIGGQTTPQMLIRFKSDVVDLKPKTVIILAGINDIAENTGPSTIKGIRNNIKGMLNIARENNIQVILCSVLPANTFPWRLDIDPTHKVTALNKQLLELTKQQQIIFADYYTPMANAAMGLKNELTYDGVHPNKMGYEVMVPIIESYLNQLK